MKSEREKPRAIRVLCHFLFVIHYPAMLHFIKILKILFIQDQPSAIRYQLHAIKELHKFSDNAVESRIDFFFPGK